MKKSELFFNVILVPLDALMIILAFVVAYLIRSWWEILPVIYLPSLKIYIKSILPVIPIWLVIFTFGGLYKIRASYKNTEEIYKIFMATSAGIMVIIAGIFLKREFFFSRLIIIYTWILAIIFVILGRFFIRVLQKWLYRYEIGVYRTVIIGNDENTEFLKEEFNKNKSLGNKIIKIISPREIFKDFNILKELISKIHIDEVIQVTPSSEDLSLDLINFCEDNKIKFRFVPNLFEAKSINVETETIAGIPVISFQKTPLEGWWRIFKRLMDIVLSFLALTFLIPIFLTIALLVKLDSKGPVFFKHERIGKGGKLFLLLKFRTMIKNAEEILNEKLQKDDKFKKQFEKNYKIKEDSRVTRLGKFLRKTSLDELPQFINVLKGDISLVGPRPVIKQELKKYGPFKNQFLALKPGITGLWQISGRTDLSYDDRIKLDIYYIENWSLWLDVQILLKTIPTIIKRRGAY